MNNCIFVTLFTQVMQRMRKWLAGRVNFISKCWNEFKFTSVMVYIPIQDQECCTNGWLPESKLQSFHKGLVEQNLKTPPNEFWLKIFLNPFCHTSQAHLLPFNSKWHRKQLPRRLIGSVKVVRRCEGEANSCVLQIFCRMPTSGYKLHFKSLVHCVLILLSSSKLKTS